MVDQVELVDAVRGSSDWLNDLRDEEIEHICRAVLEASDHAELVEALHEARSRCDTDQPPLIRLSNVRITLDEALAKVRTPTTPERSDG